MTNLRCLIVALLLALSGLAQAQTLYYIHADHLNTPRLIADEAGNTVWRWDNREPFGTNAPSEYAGANGQPVRFNLRFPGQYYDAETGTFYNYFRDYDPQTGRYVQSDPIGLAGGINTYLYVNGNPISFADPKGLQALPFPVPIPPPAGSAANDPVFGPTHGGGGGCPPDCNEFKKSLDDTYIALQRAKRTSGLLMNATFNTLYETYFWVSVRNYERSCGPYTPPFPEEPNMDSIHDFYSK